MNASHPADDSRLQRMEQAALWLQRMHAGTDDERMFEDWLDWCQRHPLNQQAFDELAAIWELTGNLGAAQTAGSGIAPGASRAGWSRRAALAASLGALIVTAGAGLWWVNRPAAPVIAGIELISPIGVNSSERLADGSLLELGGGTRVTVTIGPRERRVQLHEGELFVTVQKDPQRPFAVHAGRLEAIATGTAFNVRRTASRITVTVAEGSVEAVHEERAAMQRRRLQPNQQLIYALDTQSADFRNVKPEVAGAWRSGNLSLAQDEPLGEIIAAINRYVASPILIEDPRVAAFGYGGNVHVDKIRGFLEGLPASFPVRVVRLPDGRQRIEALPGALPE